MFAANKQEYGYISIEDFERVIAPLWGTKREEFAVMFSLMRYRAFAPEEAASLHMTQVTSQDCTNLTYHRNKLDTNSPITLPPIAAERLREHIRKNHRKFKNGFIFSARTKKQPHTTSDQARRVFRRLLKKADIPLSYVIDTRNPLHPRRKMYLLRLYDLRASSGSDVQLRMRDVYKTMVWLRHKSLQHTMKYMRRALLADEKNLAMTLYPSLEAANL